MTTAVDTNVLLDLLIAEAPHNPEAREALATAHREGVIVISEAAFAELGGYFGDRARLVAFIEETRLRLEPSTTEVLLSAGIAWRDTHGGAAKA